MSSTPHIYFSTLLIVAGLLYNSEITIDKQLSINTLPVSTDTLRFAATYATALPSLMLEQWKQDYSRYEQFLTLEIRKTQQSMSFTHDGVQTWWCSNSARPHAQLDTMTRVTDVAQLLGNWRSVTNRIIVHIDSFSVADQKIYRSATVHAIPSSADVVFTAQKVSIQSNEPKAKRVARNYSLSKQRYLFLYGASKAAGNVVQVGIDAENRLLLHNCSVTERKIPGRYLTYRSTIHQSIFTRY